MHERLIMYQKISDAEKKKNEFFDFYEREFSFEDDGSQLVFNMRASYWEVIMLTIHIFCEIVINNFIHSLVQMVHGR